MKRKAVMVKWLDAADHSPGEWAALPKKTGAVITTVAILVRKTPTTLVIAQSFDDNAEPLFRGVFAIPRACVIELTELDG